MNVNYRHEARQHLQGAKNELTANSDERLKFAALELRMTMECLTYDRALAFKDEFPPKEYETWQPKKVMAVLLEIDPDADKDSTWAMGTETAPGQPAPSMHSLGSEKVLNMSEIKKHYDALGSFLHVPSMKQVREQTPLDFGKLRTRCNDLATIMEQALASTVFNATIGNFATIDCLNCGKPIRKRMPHAQVEVKAECLACVASYVVTICDDGTSSWTPCNQEIKCANPKCQEKVTLWDRQLAPGHGWTCKVCQGQNVVGLRLVFMSDETQLA